jgi:hypothetical protein
MGRTQRSDGLHTLRRLPGFAIPSAALMQANPKLREVEFRVPTRIGIENDMLPYTPRSYDEALELSEQLQDLIDEDLGLSVVGIDGPAPNDEELKVSVKYVAERPGWMEALWREYVLGSPGTRLEVSRPQYCMIFDIPSDFCCLSRQCRSHD